MTHTPKRVRINWRVKGGRKPDNVVSVIRGTPWGNPVKVGSPGIPDNAAAVEAFKSHVMPYRSHSARPPVHGSKLADYLASAAFLDAVQELKGRDLACWCKLCDRHKDGLPLGETCPDCDPCHADVLLALANEGEWK